ncbi:MAG: UDP-3-O-(3-hydroxymyristoyl)glucosamine N-acyltransferase [Verrucomicrobiota bacterium]
MRASLSVSELRSILPGASWEGSGPDVFSGVASLKSARAGDLTFLAHRRHAPLLEGSAPSGVLLPKDFEGPPPDNCHGNRVAQPSLAFAMVCEVIERALRVAPPPGIHPTAWVDPTAEIDPSASIGPQCLIEAGARIAEGAVLMGQVYVGRGAVVGPQAWIHPQVAIHRDCILGQRVQLHSGVVIGGDGFGYEQTPRGAFKVPQIGHVEIGDDVEIGANSTVDRGRVDPTRIGPGTKIDNLVQIAHNVEIGAHCFFCGQAGVAGSTKVGNFVMVGGQAAISDHLEIGDGCLIAGQAGIAKSLPAKSKVAGSPAIDLMQKRRLDVLVRRLPELFARVRPEEAD